MFSIKHCEFSIHRLILKLCPCMSIILKDYVTTGGNSQDYLQNNYMFPPSFTSIQGPVLTIIKTGTGSKSNSNTKVGANSKIQKRGQHESTMGLNKLTYTRRDFSCKLSFCYFGPNFTQFRALSLTTSTSMELHIHLSGVEMQQTFPTILSL